MYVLYIGTYSSMAEIHSYSKVPYLPKIPLPSDANTGVGWLPQRCCHTPVLYCTVPYLSAAQVLTVV